MSIGFIKLQPINEQEYQESISLSRMLIPININSLRPIQIEESPKIIDHINGTPPRDMGLHRYNNTSIEN